jgi:trehalose synthase
VLPLVHVGRKSLADYATLVSRGLLQELRRLAEPLQGRRVVHVSATAFGGGVAEINYTLVPLMADVGLDVEWRIIHGADEFFNVTKAIHNGLQGDSRSLTAEEREVFARYNAENAAQFAADDYDVVVVHDPQPIALIDHFRPDRAGNDRAGNDRARNDSAAPKWVWRGHIDFSKPNPEIFDVLLPSLRRYDAAVFHMREYAPTAPGLPDLYIWPPAIDPLAPKNMALSPEDASYIVDQFGVDLERPLLTQVSRFDPWKDPLGVIDAYRLVKREFPAVQLALVGSMAHDDPEGWDYYKRTVEHADGDPDIHILSNMNSVGAVEVNAFQVHSQVTLQKSIREGFGLTVTEALWKARPTVAGRVGGIVAQITDHETGWLVDSPEQCAEACIEILRDPAAARVIALRGKEHVRRFFLTPRLLHDWLVLFNRLLDTGVEGAELTRIPAGR